MSIKVDCYGQTHVGRVRQNNEDQFLIADLNRSLRVHQTSIGLDHQTKLFSGSHGKLFLVADGAGGHVSGERASTLAIDGITDYVLNAMNWFCEIDRDNRSDFISALKESFLKTQAGVLNEGAAIPQNRGMATTLTLAFVDWPKMYTTHVGDSRCYLHQGGKLNQITTDHTLNELAKAAAAELGEKAGDAHGKNVLWNVLGGNDRSLQPEVRESTLQPGDLILLCTDGLTRHLEDEELQEYLGSVASAETVCRQLVSKANQRGGGDNITAVVAKFVNEECLTADSEADSVINYSSQQINRTTTHLNDVNLEDAQTSTT